MYPMTNQELQSLMNDCSSIKKVENNRIIWKERAILDSKGQLVPLESFQKAIGANPMAKRIIFQKNPEIRAIKKAWKKSHANYKPTVTFKLVPGNKFQWELMKKTLNLN